MSTPSLSRLMVGAGLLGVVAVAWQCRAAEGGEPVQGAAPSAASAKADGWSTIYTVLQHPRCMNCHPAGDAPLQGDESLPHAQNVQRGPDGQGLFAMRCATCHQTANTPGAHLPPGAPNWHLPRSDMPLVFQGKSSSELCKQLRDPATNGGKSRAALLEHIEDPLVLWGWDPGAGRTPVPVPHDEFASAVRSWVEGGCGCPGE